MWHAMFALQIPVAEKILRTIIIYALITVLFRVVGKRDLAALSTFDFVVVFVLSNVVQNAVIGNDTSVTGGVIGAVTLVTVNAGINRLTVISPAAARIFDGTAITIIKDGRLVDRAMRRLGLRPAEIDHVVRMQNGDDVSEVETGVFEPSGQIVLTLKAEEQSATKADIAGLATRLAEMEKLLRRVSKIA